MKIKLTLLTMIFAASFAVSASTAQFCSGFQSGYEAGYKKVKNTTLKPLPPLCPLQPLKGFGDPDSDWEHGYQIGFLKGLNS